MTAVKIFLAGVLLLTIAVAAGQKHETVPPPLVAPRYSYRGNILPILQAKCQPCHFEGGKVFAKLPFNDSTVVAKLGKRLNTRLKDSTDQAVILSWSAHAGAK